MSSCWLGLGNQLCDYLVFAIIVNKILLVTSLLFDTNVDWMLTVISFLFGVQVYMYIWGHFYTALIERLCTPGCKKTCWAAHVKTQLRILDAKSQRIGFQSLTASAGGLYLLQDPQQGQTLNTLPRIWIFFLRCLCHHPRRSEQSE